MLALVVAEVAVEGQEALKTIKLLILKKTEELNPPVLAYLWHVYGTRRAYIRICFRRFRAHRRRPVAATKRAQEAWIYS